MRFKIREINSAEPSGGEFLLLADGAYCGVYDTAVEARDCAVKLHGADAGAISYEWAITASRTTGDAMNMRR